MFAVWTTQEDKFRLCFGLEWQEALDSGRVFNAMDACEELGLTAEQMDTEWANCKKANQMHKFGGGFYWPLARLSF